MRVSSPTLLAAMVLGALFGCSANDGLAEEAPRSPLVSLPQPLLPATAGELSPTHASLSDPFDVDVFTDVESCGECHPNQVREWRESTHHLASFNNPFYRASFEDYVAEVGRSRGRFCAGCHDPALLSGDALTKPIAPTDHRAHAGVTCVSCHGVQNATPTGVGSYTLEAVAFERPLKDDAQSLARHREAMANPVLKSDALCISCHKGFLSQASGHDNFIPALDEHRPWRESCLLYTSPSPRDKRQSRMPSSA